MRYLEPVIDEDDVIINLLLLLDWNDSDAGAEVFKDVIWIRTWSARALQLCMIAMRSQVGRGITVSIPTHLKVSDLKCGGHVVVHSSPYSTGWTVLYLSCGRELLAQTDVECDGYVSAGTKECPSMDTESGKGDEDDSLGAFSKAKVWARVSNDGCRCGLNGCGGKSWRGLLKERIDGGWVAFWVACTAAGTASLASLISKTG